ncbi:hypothetical protein SLS62_000354 [Diatrype stigma]|uniref:Frequency clock protein n=1 Tax=Diatrype stigma TaxID=117547 RepID=A0AAN9V2P3_9PEZI
MPDPTNMPLGSEPPPPSGAVTYRNPRRASPESSITLRNHRLAREATERHLSIHATTLPRLESSGESNDSGVSDGRKWFDRTNQNFKGHLDTSGMDVDPPFFQKETYSSVDDSQLVPSQSPAYRCVQNRAAPTLRQEFTESSSADDYRSVIDDLTIENKRLKEELKRYRQRGPDSLRRDKLFEVKVHGLPSRKKRELEVALRDFTTSLEGSSTGESHSRRSRGHGKTKTKTMNSSSDAPSKHVSSSGSNSRPVDSAYASMSATGSASATGTGSSAPSLGKAAKQRSFHKIENYLRDIPDGLWPRAKVMTETDRKKWVVRRLERLFTGKLGGQKEPSQVPTMPAPLIEDVEMETETITSDNKSTAPISESSREAKIRPREQQQMGTLSYNTGSASNEHSRGDRTESRDTSGDASGNGCTSSIGGGNRNNTSPQGLPETEQRPTRPRDLDPDRPQVPSDNMKYIRHLGLSAPEAQKEYSSRDVSPDADGWVYLNLLCSLAQLHILNVTNDFIRSAVMEKSTKLQVSPDGRKIRWRGGGEGTKFSSDGSGRDSQKNQSSDDTDGSNDQEQRKKQKTQCSTSLDGTSHNPTDYKPQVHGRQESNSTESFHYKPLFVHHNTSSSDEQPSGEETSSSYGAEESNLGPKSRWGQSGVSGPSQRKRRRDGAIIYYSGAPFCTDLSGDIDASPDDDTSSGDQGSQNLVIRRPDFYRSSSGSTLPYRSLSGPSSYGATMELDDLSESPELTSGETDNGNDDIEANFEWSDSQQQAPLVNLEASGLAGIYPEDHFLIAVTTKRPKSPQLYGGSDDVSIAPVRPKMFQPSIQEALESHVTPDVVARRLAAMTTRSPRSPQPWCTPNVSAPLIGIQYLSDQTYHLPPVPLPPPAFYYGSSNSELDDDESDGLSDGFTSHEDDDESSSPQEDLSGNDEEDEHSDGGLRHGEANEGSPLDPDTDELSNIPIGRSRAGTALSGRTRSSAATAGGAPSGDYDSSMDDI